MINFIKALLLLKTHKSPEYNSLNNEFKQYIFICTYVSNVSFMVNYFYYSMNMAFSYCL